ncbi:MAG: hypothetical protein LKE40_12020 [Spirochaetia bacterium]|jgi:DNA invertase Pin-like site-specific DNA recombinase|nr:hypothetical protein [Spirochaetia bacterium]
MRDPLRFYSLQTKIQARRNEELLKMPIIESIRKLKMDGYTPTEIARSLDINRGTVYKYQDRTDYDIGIDEVKMIFRPEVMSSSLSIQSNRYVVP